MPTRTLADLLRDLTVAEIMARWPETIAVFIAFRLHCVGCPIAPFHTLVDAAAEHRIGLEPLLEEVLAKIEGARAAPASARLR